MNVDIKTLFAKQAAWQHSRAARPWAEKLRASIAMRSSLLALRRQTPRHGTMSPGNGVSSSRA